MRTIGNTDTPDVQNRSGTITGIRSAAKRVQLDGGSWHYLGYLPEAVDQLDALNGRRVTLHKDPYSTKGLTIHD